MVITAQNINQKPGYKQTELGMIPEDWEVCALGDVVTKVGSGITPTGGEKVYKKEGRPFLRSQNVGRGHLLLDDIAFIDEETHSSFLATEIKLDDVLLNITGASIGRSAVADDRLLGGNVNQHVCIIRADASKLSPYYLNFFLLSESGQKQIESFQAGGNRQGLNFGQIKSFQIPLPPFPEQRAIATALSDVDALITSLDKLIAKKRDIKQATMQQLLTGKTRLPGFSEELKVGYKQTEVGMIPEDWDVHSVEEIADVITGDKDTQDKTESGAYPFFVRSQIVERINSYSYDGEAVLTAGDGVGVGKVFHYANGKFDFHQRVYMIYNFRKFDGFFFYLYFSNNFYKEATKYNAKNSVDSVRREMVTGMKIPHPPLPEQQAIAAVLSDMDAEIAALEQKRDKTRALKQGMMQELLTGKTRLV